MGYFASIIKDSRLNLSTRRSQGPSYQLLNGQQALDVTVTDRSITGNRPRHNIANQSLDVADSGFGPTVARPNASHEMSAVNVNTPGSKAERMEHVKKTHAIRSHRSSADEHSGSDGSIESTEVQNARPVIQRKATASTASRGSAAAGPEMSAVPQPGVPPRNRPSSHPERSLRQSSGADVPQPARKSPIHPALPEGDRRPATLGLGSQFIKSGDPPLEQRSLTRGESHSTPIGQPDRPAGETVPVEAVLKSTITKPPLSEASIASADQVGDNHSAPVGHDDRPRVQIGQVNVIVEESRVSPKSPPGNQRGDDLVSRTFLRSL